MVKAMIVMLLCVPAHSERVSRSQSGTAVCPDRAVRVLAIGGELQANSWCDKQAGIEKRKAHEDKKKSERDEYKLKQKEERAKRKAEDERRREEEKRRREEERKRKEHDCRGIGSGAGCTEANPGKGNGETKAKKKN